MDYFFFKIDIYNGCCLLGLAKTGKICIMLMDSGQFVKYEVSVGLNSHHIVEIFLMNVLYYKQKFISDDNVLALGCKINCDGTLD